MIVRQTTPECFYDIELSTREAFWNLYRPGCLEHLIAHKIRHQPDYIPELDMYVEKDGEAVGNILYALGSIHTESGEHIPALTLCQISIRPDRQKKGYGYILTLKTLKKAANMDYSCIFALGELSFFEHFGFEPASRYGIKADNLPEQQSNLLIKVLDPEKVKNLKGHYSQPESYMVDEQELEHFDTLFRTEHRRKKNSLLFDTENTQS